MIPPSVKMGVYKVTVCLATNKVYIIVDCCLLSKLVSKPNNYVTIKKTSTMELMLKEQTWNTRFERKKK